MLGKCSIPVMLPSDNNKEWQPTSSDKSRSACMKDVQKDQIVDGKQRLPVFVPKPLHCKTRKV